MSSRRDGSEWGTVSRTLERLQDASVLLARAREESDEARVGLTCGCATLLLVIALEEEVSLVIRSRTEGARRTGEAVQSPAWDATLGQLLSESVSPWRRVSELPRRLSRGRLALRAGSDQVTALQEVLALRNPLLHNTPDNLFEIDLETGEWIQSGASSAGITLDGTIVSGQRRGSLPVLPWARDPWREITVRSVDRFSNAVRVYIEELQELDLDDEDTYQGHDLIGPVAP